MNWQVAWGRCQPEINVVGKTEPRQTFKKKKRKKKQEAINEDERPRRLFVAASLARVPEGLQPTSTLAKSQSVVGSSPSSEPCIMFMEAS